jgi:hypothetical protein
MHHLEQLRSELNDGLAMNPGVSPEEYGHAIPYHATDGHFEECPCLAI